MKFGFEVKLVGIPKPIGSGNIDSSILDLFKGKEEEFDRNIKFIALNFFIEQMEKSELPIDRLLGKFLFEIFREANIDREPNNLILPMGVEVDIII